jgi:signal transduction histidine kinase
LDCKTVNLSRKNLAVYLLLACAWPMMVLWLVFEHGRVQTQARELLLNRARDISNTIALLSRSGGFNVIRQTRLEEALHELTRSGELISVELLNSQGAVVAEAGPPLPMKLSDLPQQGARWADDKVTVVNLVNFGATLEDRGTTAPLAIVIPSEDDNSSPSRRRFNFPRPPSRSGKSDGPPRSGEGERRPPGDRPPPDEGGPPPPPREGETSGTLAAHQASTATLKRDGTTSPGAQRATPNGPPHHDRRRDIFRRPPWMSQADYEAILREQGLHGFVLVISTATMNADIRRDFWLRMILGSIGLLAVGGLALAWHGLVDSTRLQMRLVRAHEINTHLQEMNLAAAGLAHETRNPLNIVRGMAQMITQNNDVPEQIRERTHRITEEVDRVTVRLNEFINYSKPLEPRPSPIDIQAVLKDVIRTLESDAADKGIEINLTGPALMAYADESLLRQLVFNLLLNAIQSVPRGGRVQATLQRENHGEAGIAIEDDGGGVPEQQVEDIFRPYFTTRMQGSGLGLAVVKQIALAHRWEIHYRKNDWGGATFSLQGLTLVQ